MKEGKPPVKTNRKYLAIVSVFALILVVGGVLLLKKIGGPDGGMVFPNECKQLEQEIDDLITQATYCEVDEDCVVPQRLVPGRSVCACTYAVNKDYADFSVLEKASQRWYVNCGKGIICEPCAMFPPLAKCEQNRCVGVWEQDNSIRDTSIWQTYHSEDFGFEVRYPASWQFEELDPALSYGSILDSTGPQKDRLYITAIGLSYMGIDNPDVVYQQEVFAGKPATVQSVYQENKLIAKNIEVGGITIHAMPDSNGSFSVIDQILSTFRFVEAGSKLGVPSTYEECAKIGQADLVELTDLECKYTVSYSDKDETNKPKYFECVKIGGITSSLHGDTFDPNNPPVYKYRCKLNFYNPNYQFPETFQECRDSKPEWLRASIDSQGRCNVAIENITHSNEDIANNLMDKCIALGGSYTEYPNPNFAKTQCVLWLKK